MRKKTASIEIMRTMTAGRPAALIFKFSLPLLAGNVLQQMYNLVDSVIVGNFVGKEALAAVGSTFILNFLLVSLFSGLATGFSIVISQFFGAGNHDGVRRTVDTAYVVAVLGAALVTVVGIALSGVLLDILNTPAGITLEMSRIYLIILFVGTIGNFGYNLNAGILQGLGDSTSSLIFLAVATVINIALDLIFVLFLGWGVAGVALATIIAQLLSFLAGTWFIVKRRKLTTLQRADIRFDGQVLKECVRIGLPGGIQMMLFSVGTIALQRLVNSYGPTYMAAFGASSKIDSLAFMPVASFATASMTYTGQNFGAGRLDRVRSGFRSALLMSVGSCAAASVFVLVFARQLMGLFSPELEVVTAGIEILHRLMPFYVLLAVLFSINAVLRGTGESLWPFIAAFTSFMIIRLPAAYLLNHFFGRSEIGWCFALGWIGGLGVIVPFYLRGRWQRRFVPPSASEQ